jgi:hypothetical protein
MCMDLVQMLPMVMYPGKQKRLSRRGYNFRSVQSCTNVRRNQTNVEEIDDLPLPTSLKDTWKMQTR